MTQISLTNLLLAVTQIKCLHETKEELSEKEKEKERIVYSINVDHCSKCAKFHLQSKKDLKKIFDVLEEKTPQDFIREEHPPCGDIKLIMSSFESAKVYRYNSETFDLVFTSARKISRDPKKLIGLLVEAGILNIISKPLHNQLEELNDEDLCWYIFYLGIEPTGYIYRKYGRRMDKIFSEKKKMFEMFFEKAKIGFDNDISFVDCFQFSEDPKEVKFFIDWFLSRRMHRDQSIFSHSFFYFGTELFDFLDKRGFILDGLDKIIGSKVRSLEEKLDALDWIKRRYSSSVMITFCTPYTLSNILDEKNLNLIKKLITMDIPVNNLFLKKLFMQEFENSCQLSMGFIKECVNCIFQNIRMEILEKEFFPKDERDNKFCFHLRDNYRLNGELYNWLIESHPAMLESLKRYERHLSRFK